MSTVNYKCRFKNANTSYLIKLYIKKKTISQKYSIHIISDNVEYQLRI